MSDLSGTVGNCTWPAGPWHTCDMRGRLSAAGRLFRLPLALAALVLVTCGPDAAPNCPYMTPVCPDPAPSYAGEVSALIQTYCVGCHGPGGQESIRPFGTWQDIDSHAYAGPMLQQLIACRMPPADAPQPSDVEKQTLIGWLTCGHPDN
jgi:hypothetical protein